MSAITLKDTSGVAKKFLEQINAVKNLIQKNNDKPQTPIYDFLSGKDVAGIGQGRFTNEVKKLILEKWDDVKQKCNAVVVVKDLGDTKDEFKHLKELQKILIEYCKKKGAKSKNGEPIIPWAAIHAMVAVLRPEDFCTIVSENNLDNLYKLLSDYYRESTDTSDDETVTNTDNGEGTEAETGDGNNHEVAEESQSENDSAVNEGDDNAKTETNKKTTIDLDKGKRFWKDVVKAWENAKKESKGKKNEENVSWYIKSMAMHNFFKKLTCDDYWRKQSYAWETLIALRGDERIKTLAEKLQKQYNIILTGAPGTGKTYLARQIAAKIIGCNNVEDLKEDKYKERFEFVQFHPSYDYTDFVEGLRPYESKDDSGKTTITFKREDGIFKKFCAKAAKEEDNNSKHVFIIDEINRGEISKIFGELFFSIDPGYRSKKDRIPVNTQYQNLLNKETSNQESNVRIFKDGFYVPSNVYIIGTMNDIDRSVESMDFAFRRRFAFIEVTADDSENMLLTDKEINDSATLVDKMHNLNAAILKCGLTSQYQIGGAYFKKIKVVKNYAKLWNEYLQGTLYEYFRGEPKTEITKKMELLKEAYDKGNGEE